MKKSITLILGLLFVWNVSAQDFAIADSIIHSHYQDGIPGVAVTVIQHGKTVYSHQVGLANLENNISISDSSAFYIASVSKQFTAYLAILLEQEGKLRLDDDLRTYLPELGHLEYAISLNQLASHTHGLPNVSELGNLKGFGISDRMWHRDVVNMALKIETFNFKPGDDYQYNNTGYVLLAEIIERVCEMPFQACLEKYIFKPLAMQHSMAVSSPNYIIHNRVESYSKSRDGYERLDVGIMDNGSSGIRTTIKDLAIWAAHFQSTFGKSDSPFTKMVVETKLNDGTVRPYGLGLESRDYKGNQVVFHGGGTGAYRAYLLHLPIQNISVAILGNTQDYWPLEIAYKLADVFSGQALVGTPDLGSCNYTTKELKAFEGTYEFFPGQYYIFSASQDSLYLSFPGQDDKILLQPLNENAFVFPYYPKARFIFDQSGLRLRIADFTYPFTKTDLVLKDYNTEELQEFVGFYHNAALNTIYEIVVNDGRLVAKHAINADVLLSGLAGDKFYSHLNYFGRIQFERDGNNRIEHFELSAQNVERIVFEKITR